MPSFFPDDWDQVLLPDTPLLEIFVRGTIVYLGLLVLLRFVLKRQAGAISMTDLVFVVLIADAAQNAMADDYRSLPDGLILVSVILAWSYALDWVGYRVPAVQRFVHPPPLPLVKAGRILPRNLRHELITEDELMSQLREQGVEDLAKVKIAHMEGDGRISIITYKDRETKGKSKNGLPHGG